MRKYLGIASCRDETFTEIFSGRRVMISWTNHSKIDLAFKVCTGVAIDNGAFLSKNRTNSLRDWDKFYSWIEQYHNRDFFVIPDIFDGTEKENDKLLHECPFEDGVPVWKSYESTKKLERLMEKYQYIAIGMKKLRYDAQKLHQTMMILCNSDGTAKIKIHLLGCLDPKLYQHLPVYSADSSYIARNYFNMDWRKKIRNVERTTSTKKYVGII